MPNATPKRRGIGIATLLLTMAVAMTALAPRAHADGGAQRIAELTDVLSKSSNDKERLAAVTALARLGDKRSLRPLVGALHDPSPAIRSIAAVALGRLGHRASIPALKDALDDSDDGVRKQVHDAYLKVCHANKVTPDAGTDVAATGGVIASSSRVGFGNSPRAVASRPDLYVLIKSSSDDAPGKFDRATRQVHSDVMREALAESLRGDQSITSTASVATQYALDPRLVDLSVVKLESRSAGSVIEIEAQLRLAISDDSGRMLSFVSGGAVVNVPKRTFNPQFLPQLRKEALENAVRGLYEKLVVQLRRGARS